MQFQVSPTAGVMAPSLVVVPSAAGDAAGKPGSDCQILGLTLTQRTVLAARRAGYGRVFFLDRDAPPGAETIRDWRTLAQLLPAQPLAIVPATILSETGWLRLLATTRIAPAAWASLPNRVVLLDASILPEAFAMLESDGDARDFTTVEQRLADSFGPGAALADKISPTVVGTPQDIPAAEARLLRGLIKDTDGFMTRHVDRHISLPITRRLAPTNVTPTHVTLLSIAIGLCGAPFFLSSHWTWQTVGALLFLLHSIVDGCDGELARLKFQESRLGGLLDFLGDNIVHVAVFGCIAAGWTLSSGASWPLGLGAAAILGTIASALFVYWTQVRGRKSNGSLFASLSGSADNRLGRVLDAMSSRDFIYLTPIAAFFGKANWILIFSALGAPIFFVLLVIVATRNAAAAKRQG